MNEDLLKTCKLLANQRKYPLNPENFAVKLP